ncbi:TIGR03016 family PEP-CTERM system-associated outer membrane protein [Massilia sp. CF038]|uniref:TIGR03016 family PEP-CTERM system-associated outer membrane protein n=1 Tax=Massilia sp. CF038 TaxID=1881045 RepID=UPI000921A0DF|nr:TIGR03016 family PEP-CTERM system-associated outer membrane protein [Massilia sp. CF038]SHH41487.1 uncharacterized protein, PEP-CTERM system associated [Massilia sp. CF038]
MTITTAKLAQAVAHAYARPLAVPLALTALLLGQGARAADAPPLMPEAPVAPLTPGEAETGLSKWAPLAGRDVPTASFPLAAPLLRKEKFFTPTLDLRQSYSDNVALRPDGLERGSFVSEIAPGFRVKHTGPRLALNGQYEFHYYKMSDSDIPGVRRSSRMLRADGKAELVNELLYMDANAGIANQSISAFAQTRSGSPYTTANQTEVRSWRISPYLVHRFGSTASGELRYARDAVDSGTSGLGNTDGDTLSLRLNSGPSFKKFSWNLTASQQEIRDTERNDSTIKTTNLGMAYQLGHTFNVLAGVGYDDYDYQALGGSTAGRAWNAGLGWTPSRRTSIQATLGHRYYGPSRTLNATHRSRRTVWSIKYDDTVTTTRANFIIPSAVDTATLLDGLFLGTFPDPAERARAVDAYIRAAGLPPSIADNINFFSNRYMLQKQLRATMAFRGGRSGAVVSLFHLRRDALSVRATDSELLGSSLNTINDNVKQAGIETQFSYRLSGRTNLNLVANVTNNESLTTALQTRTHALRLSANHQLGARMVGTVELRHIRGNAAVQIDNPYTENAVAASISMQL